MGSQLPVCIVRLNQRTATIHSPKELIMETAEEPLYADSHEKRTKEREAKEKAFFEMIAREYSEGRLKL